MKSLTNKSKMTSHLIKLNQQALNTSQCNTT